MSSKYSSGSVKSADFLVIGGGIIGLSIARQLISRYPDQSIVILEKEAQLSMHASGRNSGVMHAGFYYTADSLKARFCRDGNRLMTDYCLEHGLPVNQCGKAVVTRNADELNTLDELFKRGQKNGVALEIIDESQLREIEPRARTCGRALYSPATSTVDPLAINQHIYSELAQQGTCFSFNTRFLTIADDNLVRTNQGDISAGYIINAAGLYADRVAKQFGFSKDYTILPFKGLYLYTRDNFRLNTNIYPVPDLNNPFLGVHFTLTVDGKCKIGPTAIPAFWREHYRGFSNFDPGDCFEVVARESGLLFRNAFNFRKLAVQELAKYYKPHLIRLASELVPDISSNQCDHWGRAGIRAQLLNIENNTLEMDFKIEGDDKSMHVLNAVSPAYTCAFPFSEYIVDRIGELTK